jgi:aspartate/methionine/tyrosine aminotransferase
LIAPPSGARWRVDLDGLAASLGPRSRALLAIHPHNPTGSRLDPDDLASFRALARERGLALLSDEVFAESFASGPPFASLLCGAADGPLHFVLSGASKLLGLPQLKVAWIAAGGPPAARDDALARLEFIADAFLSVSPLLARALARLLPQREALTRTLRARVAGNRARLAALPAGGPLVARPGEAGWAAILRVRARAAGDEALARRLLDETGVLVQPGSLFELAPRPEEIQLVLSLLPEPGPFARGLDALSGFAARLA